MKRSFFCYELSKNNIAGSMSIEHCPALVAHFFVLTFKVEHMSRIVEARFGSRINSKQISSTVETYRSLVDMIKIYLEHGQIISKLGQTRSKKTLSKVKTYQNLVKSERKKKNFGSMVKRNVGND